MDTFDKTKPYEEVIGFGFTTYKYFQDGKYFNAKGLRVDPKTGNVWDDRNEEKLKEVENLKEASKKDASIKGAARAAAKGVELPKRILTMAGSKK
jgi:hypothetical protein